VTEAGAVARPASPGRHARARTTRVVSGRMADMPLPLTGAQHQISAGDYSAVVTELGAGLRQLRYGGRPLLTGYDADQLPPAAAGQLLVPWPNRVDGGRYSVGGRQFQLDLSEPAAHNAIHGLTRWVSWAPGGRATDHVLLRHVLLGRPGYPFCLHLEAEYRLDAAEGLWVRVTARNEGSGHAPYGTGSHPYLTAGTPTVDECELTLPARRWQPSGDRGIPDGPARDVGGGPFDFRTARKVGDVRLDHAFTGLDRDATGRAWVRLTGSQGGVALWAGEGYHWLQVFTGDALGEQHRRRALAVEPMTCPPNAFVTGTDLLMLEPGQTVRHSWGVRALTG
jgi:aldose 1-epimerase